MLWHVSLLSCSKLLYQHGIQKHMEKFLNIKHNNEIPHYSIGTSSTVNLCYNKITKFSLYSHCLPGSLFFQKLSPIPWFYLLILHLAPYTHSAHPTVLWFSTSAFSFMHNIHHLLPDYIIYVFTYLSLSLLECKLQKTQIYKDAVYLKHL